MHSVPGGGRRSDGGGVVHRGAGKEAEALVGEAQHTSQSGEDQSRDDVEQEDHRDGLGDLLVIRADDRGSGGDGAAAADGGAYADESGDVAVHVQGLIEGEGHDQAGGDGGDDDGQ